MPALELESAAPPDELVFPSELETGDGSGNFNGPGDFDPGGHGGGGDGDDGEQDSPAGIYRVGMWAMMSAVGTLFIVLAIAYIARSAMPRFWQPVELPKILWFSTGVLLLSSLTCEAARRSLSHFRETAYGAWLFVTALLGIVFLVMQVKAWQRLADQGAFLSENPHSSFFYLFTAAHGLHLAAGAIVLAILAVRAWLPLRRRQRMEIRLEIAGAATVFWHFMDGIWIALFTLLLVRG